MKQTILKKEYRTELATQISILSNGSPVGAIQNFSIKQKRNSHSGILEIDRIIFDGLNMIQAFCGPEFKTLDSLNGKTFEVEVKINKGDIYEINKFHFCEFLEISKTYSAETYIVVEHAIIKAELMTVEETPCQK